MSEEDTGGIDRSDVHDGYSHAQHFFGDACPGGHLEHLEADLDELGPDLILPPSAVEDDRASVEALVGDLRYEEVHPHNTPTYFITRSRRREEERLSRIAERWPDDVEDSYDLP